LVADKLGITSAVICAVHCLVIPAIFLLKYSLTDSLAEVGANSEWGRGLPDWWEKIDYIFLFVGLVAVYHAAAHAVIGWVKGALWLFWICLGIAVVFESQLHWMAYIASAGLIITHFFNIRLQRKFRQKAPL
jgi:hypothetical protein